MAFPLRSPPFLVIAAAVAGLIALWTPGETVQAQNAPPAVAPTPRLALTAEQEYIIREIILKDSNVQNQNTAPETVGDVVPEDVKLYPLPQDVIQKVPLARSHMFFVKDDEVILVSSSDRRVADVIKKKSTDQSIVGDAEHRDKLGIVFADQEGAMAITRMFVRSGLLTIALMSGIATAKAICRFTFRSDGKPERTRPQRLRHRSGPRSSANPLRRDPPSLVERNRCSGARLIHAGR